MVSRLLLLLRAMSEILHRRKMLPLHLVKRFRVLAIATAITRCNNYLLPSQPPTTPNKSNSSNNYTSLDPTGNIIFFNNTSSSSSTRTPTFVATVLAGLSQNSSRSSTSCFLTLVNILRSTTMAILRLAFRPSHQHCSKAGSTTLRSR